MAVGACARAAAWLAPLQEEWRGEVEQVSWSPRAYIFKKFLSDAECDHLINNVRTITCARIQLQGDVSVQLMEGFASQSLLIDRILIPPGIGCLCN